MKKFLWTVVAIKAPAVFMFTGAIMWLTVMKTFWGEDTIPVDFIWQLIFLSLIFGALHLLAFSENTLGRTGTPGRIAFLGLTMLAALVVFALVFHWLGENNAMSWLVFIGAYVLIYLAVNVVERILFRLGGKRYHDMLTTYKARQEE
jgi:hypothetical protein